MAWKCSIACSTRGTDDLDLRFHNIHSIKREALAFLFRRGISVSHLNGDRGEHLGTGMSTLMYWEHEQVLTLTPRVA